MRAQSIKFNNNTQKEFVSEIRQKVKDYFETSNISRFGNIHMVLKTISMFSLFFIPYILMIAGVVTNPYIMLILWIIIGFGMAGIGLSVMHDANHRSYSKNGMVNKILSYSLNLLGGFPPNWQYQHNFLHHGFTNIDGLDEDINPPGKLLRFSPNKPLYKIHRYQHYYAWFFYGLMTLSWTTTKDFNQLYRYYKEGVKLNGNKSYTVLFLELFISKMFYYLYMLVIPMIILPVPWWMVVIYYLSAHFVSGFMLSIIFQTAHVMPSSHYPQPSGEGTIENNWAIHQLSTTSDYSPNSKFFSWFVGGLNYQIEHHLFPNICHIHYKKISVIIKDTAREYNLPYFVKRNFFMALKSHFLMLKSLGR